MKERKSILDPFAKRLENWDAEGKTLAEMQKELLADGCKVSTATLSRYLESLRQSLLSDKLFNMIATGGQMNRDLEKAYKENPAPEIDQLIQVTKTLIMSLQVQGAANPELLTLANSMQQTVLNFISGKTRANLEFAKLDLALNKFQFDAVKAVKEHLAELNQINNRGDLDDDSKMNQFRLRLFGAPKTREQAS